MLTSPHLIDLVLVFTLLETGILLACGAMTFAAVMRMLLPGICVMLALRAALASAAWPYVPLALTAALIAHLFDVRARWRR